MRILTTLIAPDGGSCRIFGHDLVREGARVRELISVTGQYTSVDEELTGLENLLMIGQLLGMPKTAARARAQELLSDFSLIDAARRRVSQYSGGMRRRLDLATSLVCSPPLIFLTTQYLEEADALADWIAVLDGGRIVAEGTATDLKQRVGGESIGLTFDDGSTFRQLTDGSPESVRQLLNRLHDEDRHPRTLAIQTPTLDDAFLALTGHTAAAQNTDKETTT